MAQLPPKVPPNVAQDQDHHQNRQNQNQNYDNDHQWLEFAHENVNIPPHPQEGDHNRSWVDEFIEFSASKREAQRRIASDSSVAFIEAGVVPGFEGNKQGHDQFDKFDDEQFMSMFGTELGSNPTSTSDHNSTNEDQRQGGSEEGRERGEDKGTKPEVEEVESSCKVDNNEGHKQEQASNGTTNAAGGDQQQVIDPKRVKRILANRQSAQRSRVRKLQYISELERSVTALQSEVSMLTPRVAFLDHQRMILNVDNSALKAKIAALAQDKIFKDAHQEALKREIERLRQVYYQQQSRKKTEDTVTTSSSSLPSQPIQPSPPDIKESENEQQFIG
ncbi:hypothetical protein Cgig2_008357 [Carnegiea gigantea]|uniref:BZIP domain-containing protein n=1 Tax=Carnegiea gigantea TaxID=171969 RepID=A0A9Q1KBN3_9CARY|nr:hypothetical protein Cgig2_008357 [Carnegiea gigantea]